MLAVVLAGPFILVRPAKWTVKIGLGFALALAIGLAWLIGVRIDAAGFTWWANYTTFTVGMGAVATGLSVLTTWSATRRYVPDGALRLSRQALLIPVFLVASVLLLGGLGLLAIAARRPIEAGGVAGMVMTILLIERPVWLVGCAVGLALAVAGLFRKEGRAMAVLALVLNAIFFLSGLAISARADRLLVQQTATEKLALRAPVAPFLAEVLSLPDVANRSRHE